MNQAQLYATAKDLLSRKQSREAFALYEQLAQSGDPNCQVMIGWMYYEGLGVEKDEGIALKWFEGAAHLGSKVGAFYCGKHALISHKYDDALRWLNASANHNFGPSLLWLGLVHLRGLGVPKDQARGIDYLRRAASTGNFPAERELSLLMIRGKLGLMRVPVGVLRLLCAIAMALYWGMSDGYSDKLMG